MKYLNYDELEICVNDYKTKDKIQVFCLISNESDCPLCKGVLQSNNVFEKLENENLIDVYIVMIEDIFKIFPKPFNFLMYFYVPWNERQSPQIRDGYLPYDDMKNEFVYWINKVRK